MGAEGFVQLVAPRQTSLRVVSVVHRFAITMQRADTVKQINFLVSIDSSHQTFGLAPPPHLLVCSRLLPPFESRCKEVAVEIRVVRGVKAFAGLIGNIGIIGNIG